MSEQDTSKSECSAPPTQTPTTAQTVPTPSPAEMGLVDITEFAKIKLRVGQIEEATPVEKSNKLVRLQVNLGEQLGKRQVLAGIAKFYSPEQLVGRRIVVVANLKPAKLMGLESQGMLLAGSSEDGTQLAIIEPHPDLPLGATVR